jgi:carboxyl-terminal processing protease
VDPYKARKVAKVIAIIIALAMIITSFSFVFMLPGLFGWEGSVVYAASSDTADLDSQMKELETYIQTIKENYKDNVDYSQLVDGAYKGVIDSLGDPYSVYYETPEEAENFIEAVSGEYSGIGLSIENYNGKCRVIAPLVGTPAERSGIKSGDIVTKIDGIDISTKTLDEAADMMKGAESTKVTLLIDRAGQKLTFTLTREKIKTTSVYPKVLDDKIGYIQITSFDNDTNVEFASALETLEQQGIKSLIIDERNNPGGYTNVAMDIAAQLIPKGPIAYYMHQGAVVETYVSNGVNDYDLPTVLLVNEGSASASEILAGALQDSKTAKLIGTTTFGKGVAQVIFDEPSGMNTKLSVEYFVTPNKNKIDHVGIKPDYTVQNTSNQDSEALAQKYIGFAPMNEKVKPVAGSVGLNVYGAQQRLAMIGYSVTVSGTMDAATVDAVKKFQKENGLYASGVLDFTTMASIDKATVIYITGAKNTQDLQLEKAISLLK